MIRRSLSSSLSSFPTLSSANALILLAGRRASSIALTIRAGCFGSSLICGSISGMAFAPEQYLQIAKAEAVEQEARVKSKAAMVGFAEGKAQEGPKDIIAAQIRSQGYACNSPQSAERDVVASAANQTVWMLHCQNASYRVTLIPNLAAKVEKVGEEVRQEVHKATAPDDKDASPPPATIDTQ